MCWINTKNQLPEANAIVDVWHSFGTGGMRIVEMQFVAVPGRQFFYRPNYSRELPLDQVTHWRYPPAPPAEYANA